MALPLKLQGLVTSGEGVGVGVGVGVGDEEIVIPEMLTENPPHGFEGDGVGVGVGVGVGDDDTSGGGIEKHSKTASKLKSSQGSGVIGVEHSPSEKKLESKSGHGENELKGPQRSHVPPKEDDKHHCTFVKL